MLRPVNIIGGINDANRTRINTISRNVVFIMDDSDLEKFADGLIEFYGKNLANPEQEPKRFSWQVRSYKYIMGQKPETNPKGTENGN